MEKSAAEMTALDDKVVDYGELSRIFLQALPLADCQFSALTAEDVPAVTKIEKLLNPSPWSAENFFSSLRQEHLCLVIRQEYQCLAYAVCSQVLDEAELLILGVDKSWQRQGIGKAMLLALLEVLRTRVRGVFLEVRASNREAMCLYQSAGFNCIAQRPGYYPPRAGQKQPENALVYALELVD